LHDSVDDCNTCPAGTFLEDAATSALLHDSENDCSACPSGKTSNADKSACGCLPGSAIAVPTGPLQATSTIRLQTASGAPSFDSSGTVEGRLEIFIAGDWASVCETEGFTGSGEAESAVACRQLGNELGYTSVSASKVGREDTDDR
jgi:hypothetical protein